MKETIQPHFLVVNSCLNSLTVSSNVFLNISNRLLLSLNITFPRGILTSYKVLSYSHVRNHG